MYHIQMVKNKQILVGRSRNYSVVLGKSSASSTDAKMSVENSSTENTFRNISTLGNIIAINDNSLNAEII